MELIPSPSGGCTAHDRPLCYVPEEQCSNCPQCEPERGGEIRGNVIQRNHYTRVYTHMHTHTPSLSPIRLSKQLKSTSCGQLVSALSIELWSIRAKMIYASISPQPAMKLSHHKPTMRHSHLCPAQFSLPLPFPPDQAFHLDWDLPVCAIPSILHSRFTTHTIHYNLVPCTSRQQGNVPFLVFVVKGCPDRSITSLMRLLIQEKGPTP